MLLVYSQVTILSQSRIYFRGNPNGSLSYVGMLIGTSIVYVKTYQPERVADLKRGSVQIAQLEAEMLLFI